MVIIYPNEIGRYYPVHCTLDAHERNTSNVRYSENWQRDLEDNWNKRSCYFVSKLVLYLPDKRGGYFSVRYTLVKGRFYPDREQDFLVGPYESGCYFPKI